MKPSIISTLIAVRLSVQPQAVNPSLNPTSEYLISVGGDEAWSAFAYDGSTSPRLAEMLEGADFAQVFVPSEYSKSEAMKYWAEQDFVKGTVQAFGSEARASKTIAATQKASTNTWFYNQYAMQRCQILKDKHVEHFYTGFNMLHLGQFDFQIQPKGFEELLLQAKYGRLGTNFLVNLWAQMDDSPLQLQVDFTAKKGGEMLHPDKLPQVPRDMLLYCNKLCEYILMAAERSVNL